MTEYGTLSGLNLIETVTDYAAQQASLARLEGHESVRQRATRWIRGFSQNTDDHEFPSSIFAPETLAISLGIDERGEEEAPGGATSPPPSPPPAAEEEEEVEVVTIWVPQPSTAPAVQGPAPARVEEEEDEDEDDGEWEGDWTSALEDYE